jgi:hypothetical protein
MKNIKGIYHYGIAVHNSEEVKELFTNVLNLKLFQEREIKGEYVDHLVGKPGSSALVNFYILEKDQYIETLYWNDENKEVLNDLRLSIKNIGTSHLCLYVEDIEKIYNEVYEYDKNSLISDRIVEVSSGPNRGSRVFFARFFSYLFIEFFERHNSSV